MKEEETNGVGREWLQGVTGMTGGGGGYWCTRLWKTCRKQWGESVDVQGTVNVEGWWGR